MTEPPRDPEMEWTSALLASAKQWREAKREWLRQAQPGPIWCPVANMAEERPFGPSGRETRRGSRHFAPGAKVYCHELIGHPSHGQVEVVGRHRGSHRYVTMIVTVSWLTNWRVDLAYSPRVLEDLWPTWDGTPESKVRAEQWVRHFSSPPAGPGEDA